MRVLWIVNLELPDIARQRNVQIVTGGWLHLLSQQLKNEKGIELSIACPCNEKEYFDKLVNGIHYYSFETKGAEKKELEKIYEKVVPHLVHIWGTEFAHTFAAMCVSKERGLLSCTVISIQGLASVIAKHYAFGLPEKIIHSRTFAECIGRNVYPNIADGQKVMKQRGENEIRAIRLAEHCIGRTDWDLACVKQINPKISYHICNETLREEFYLGKWSLEKCQRHTIFFSQAHYPIKGFHNLIEALPIVKKVFPDVKVKVVGEDVFCITGIKNKIVNRSYQQYLKKRIKKYNLRNCIEWLGKLTATQMKEQYCNANVFVSASTIENSSNSIGEAMLLGVPIVASDVGGIKSLMEHNKEGILYQETAPYMLADGIIRIFRDDALAVRLGEGAKKRAEKTHDKENNKNTLLKIYELISAEEKMKRV